MDALPGTTNYFLGNDPQEWRTNITSDGRVRYHGICPGIDLVYRENGRRVEYEFVVAPGADAGGIRISFEGARKIEVNDRGDVVLDTPSGRVIQRRPVIWQERAYERTEARGGYVVQGSAQIAITIGYNDRTLPLIVDPELVYATCLGGSGADQISAAAPGPNGDVYVAGTTTGPFPVTPGAFQASPRNNRCNLFVPRINVSASALVYATYIGRKRQPSCN